MKANSAFQAGFEWYVEHERGGIILSRERVLNIIPTEGLNHLLGVTLGAVGQNATWYLSIFEGNYTPVAGLTAATYVAAATECSAYDEATRPTWVDGAVAAGAVSNIASRAEFTMNATKTIYGGALLSSSTKGGGAGFIMSAVRFSTAKNVVDNDILRLAAGITATST